MSDNMTLKAIASPERKISDNLNARTYTTIVCDWLPPEFGAVGQYMMQRARDLARQGRDVMLIGLSRERGGVEAVDVGPGLLTIIRLSCQSVGKTSILKRGLWALRTNQRLIARTHAELRHRPGGDLIVTGSPPFLSSLMILANTIFWRRQIVYRITDFYPETVLAAGRANWLRFVMPVFKRIRRKASVIEVLGQDQARRLLADGVTQEQIKLLRDTSPVPIDPDAVPLERPFEPGSIIVLYSGNLGVAHPIDVFCEAYRRHIQAGSNRVRLWFNGTGARSSELIAYCETHNLPLHVTPPVSLEQLARLVVTPEAHLILLGEKFWGYVLPSKVYACLDSGKPIIFVGPAESEVAHLLLASGDRRHTRVADVDACVRCLERLASPSS